MAQVISDTGCCGGARAALYNGRDAGIRGLFGLGGPQPGDADYVAPLPTASPSTEVVTTSPDLGPQLAPDHTKTYVALGVAVVAAVGIWYYMR